MKTTIDNWVETIQDVEGHVGASGWAVDWLDLKHRGRPWLSKIGLRPRPADASMRRPSAPPAG